MRIGFVGTGTPKETLEYLESGAGAGLTGIADSKSVASVGALARADGRNGEKKSTDVFLFGFNGGIEVSYEKELKGETRFFEDAATFSKYTKSVVICGCITDSRGHKRKSALVAENGRLIGVSDMLNVIDGGMGSGAALRVYETRAGRVGVAVAEDLLFPEVIKSLAMCGSDFIVCPFGRVGSIHSVLLRASAYCNGLPVLFCGEGYAMLAEPSGKIAFASPLSPAFFDCKITKEYHLVETRRRGAVR